MGELKRSPAAAAAKGRRREERKERREKTRRKRKDRKEGMNEEKGKESTGNLPPPNYGDKRS